MQDMNADRKNTKWLKEILPYTSMPMSADMKKIIYSNNMSNRNQLIRRLLSGLTNSELENLVRVREEACPIPAPRRQREARPIPTQRRRQHQEPGRSVQELIRHFEANPILHYKSEPK